MQQIQEESKTIFSFLDPTKPYKPFRIINKRTLQCLTDGPQITCRPKSKINIKQLWMFEKAKDEYAAIINFQNGMALTRNTHSEGNSNNLYCDKLKNRDNQLWLIQFAYQMKVNQKIQHYFWLISKTNEQQCMFGNVVSSNLRMLDMDRTLFTSLWKIQQIDQNDKHFGFSQIKSLSSGLLIQAPEISIKDEVPLIQSKQNGKGTQKWIIEKLFSNYVIRNLCSGLVLSIGQQVKQNFQLKINILGGFGKNYRKINQQVFKNSNNQKWNLIKISQNQFYFQSAEDSDKFLGSLSNRQKDPIYLLGHQNFGQQMKNILWKVTGALPETLVKQKFLGVSLKQKQ